MAGEAWYSGAHSITFSDGTKHATGKRTGYLKGKNTWNDWHLIPTSRPDIASPGVNTTYVEIPGRSGALDLTTYLTGGPTYGQRSGSWEFIVDNGWENWETIRSAIMKYLHGKTYKVVLEDVPMRYWQGRFSMNSYKSDSLASKVVIDYTLEPYSYPVLDANDDWLWDPFSFETDYTDGRERVARL